MAKQKDPLDDLDLNDLKPHPVAADHFQPMSQDDLKTLGEDIKANGLLECITIHEGQILDGNNRYTACRMAGRQLSKTDFVLFSGEDPLEFVLSKNQHRRHLTQEQKRELIAKLLETRPNASDRLIASIARTSHHTVADVRRKLDGQADPPAAENPTGQIAQLPAPKTTTRTGKDGKTRTTTTVSSSSEKPRSNKPLKAILEKLPLVTDGASQKLIFDTLYDLVGEKKIRKWAALKEDDDEDEDSSSAHLSQ